MRRLVIVSLVVAVLAGPMAGGYFTPGTIAQEASPAAMAAHPLVGTWIIDRDLATTTDVPVVVVVSADGGVSDPTAGAAGAWMATGPQTAAWTLVAAIDGGAGGHVIVRSTWEIAQDGDSISGPHSFTVVAPDGTALASGRAMSRGIRLPIEAVEAEGTPLAVFPTWTPITPEVATPAP